MPWNNNNRAHACLWLFETWHHDQPDVAFVPAGDWGTAFLIKSAAGESADMRAQKARTHAEMLDGAFTKLYRAQYEPNINQDGALAGMLAVLKNEQKNMSDLGDAVDSAYRFIGES